MSGLDGQACPKKGECMGKIRDLGGLVGRVEVEISREHGLKFEVEGLSVILTLVLFDLLASILHSTIQ